jgi:hypothetical protein
MRLFAMAIGLSLSAPAAAQQGISFPVSVPPECAQLAEREHVPQVIENRFQAMKAKYKLARLNDAEPLVAQCKQAVSRLRAATSG